MHVAAFHLRLGLHGGVGLQVLSQTVKHDAALLRVGHLTTAEHNRDLHARALLEEAHDVALLGLVVADVDLGTELHLLDLDLDLVLASRLGLAILLVLELLVVQDLAHRRLRVGGNLHEVQTLVVGDAQSVAHAEQAQLGAVDADQATSARSDLPVDAGTIVSGYLLHLPLTAARGRI